MIFKDIKGKVNHIIRDHNLDRLKKSVNRRIRRTVICNNCVGAMVLHDFGLAFNSPFVNLFIEPKDYLVLLNNIEYYCSPYSEIINIGDDLGSTYPIGLINGEIKIHFLHYTDFDEAVSIWRKRCTRIDYDNVYVILVQQAGCSDDMVHHFSELPFHNKVVLVNKDKQTKDQFIIPGFENQDSLGIITDYTGWNGNRFYDAYDWKGFLNIN